MSPLRASLLAWAIALIAKAIEPALPWRLVIAAPRGWHVAMLAIAAAMFGVAIVVMAALLFVEYLIDGKAL